MNISKIYKLVFLLIFYFILIIYKNKLKKYKWIKILFSGNGGKGEGKINNKMKKVIETL